jgi:hypothetical protein
MIHKLFTLIAAFIMIFVIAQPTLAQGTEEQTKSATTVIGGRTALAAGVENCIISVMQRLTIKRDVKVDYVFTDCVGNLESTTTAEGETFSATQNIDGSGTWLAFVQRFPDLQEGDAVQTSVRFNGVDLPQLTVTDNFVGTDIVGVYVKIHFNGGDYNSCGFSLEGYTDPWVWVYRNGTLLEGSPYHKTTSEWTIEDDSLVFGTDPTIKIDVKAARDQAGTNLKAIKSFGPWTNPCHTPEVKILAPTATKSCTGGAIINSNTVKIYAQYLIDGEVYYQGEVAAESTVKVDYDFVDDAQHNATLVWSYAEQGGTIDLGEFGQCFEPGPTPTPTITTVAASCVALNVDEYSGVMPFTTDFEIVSDASMFKMVPDDGISIVSGLDAMGNLLSNEGKLTVSKEVGVRAYVSSNGSDWFTSDACYVAFQEETPSHPRQIQIVKSRGSQIAMQIENEGNAGATDDFDGKFADLMSPMVLSTTVDSRALEVPHWLVDPSISFVERTIWTSNPGGDAEGKTDKGIEGKGFNIRMDEGYILPTWQGMADYNLYLRLDEEAAAGSVIAAVEKKGDNETYGPNYRPVPGNQAHREVHNPLGDAFDYEVSIAKAITEQDDPGMVAHEAFTAHAMYSVSRANGVFAVDQEQGLSWNGCSENPMSCGRYSGTMDARENKATYWPTYQHEIATYPSVPFYAFVYRDQVISYFGYYSKSGIEFSFGDPKNPESYWWNADGSLRISQEDYYGWLDHAFQTYYVEEGGRIGHYDNKVIALEIETARLMVKYHLDPKFLAFVPANLLDEIGGSYTPAFDWANFYMHQNNKLNSTIKE